MKLKIGSLLTMLMVALIATAALAAKPNTGNRAEKMWNHAVSKLQLTADQQAKLRPVFEAQAQQMKARHEQMRSQFLSVLTDEQKAQVQKMEADRKAAREAGQKYDGRGGFKSLNLTDAQKAQLKSMRQQNMQQMKAQKQQFVAQVEAELTPAQKATFEEMINRHHDRGHKGDHGSKSAPGQQQPQSPDDRF